MARLYNNHVYKLVYPLLLSREYNFRFIVCDARTSQIPVASSFIWIAPLLDFTAHLSHLAHLARSFGTILAKPHAYIAAYVVTTELPQIVLSVKVIKASLHGF